MHARKSNTRKQSYARLSHFNLVTILPSRTSYCALLSQSNVSDVLPDGTVSSMPWRKAGVKYSQNEVYLDIVEEVDAIVNVNGQVRYSTAGTPLPQFVGKHRFHSNQFFVYCGAVFSFHSVRCLLPVCLQVAVIRVLLRGCTRCCQD